MSFATLLLTVAIVFTGDSGLLPSIEELGAGIDKRQARYRNFRLTLSVETELRPGEGGMRQWLTPDAALTRERYRATDTWLLASPERSKENSWMWRFMRLDEADPVPPLLHVAWNGSVCKEFFKNHVKGRPNEGIVTPFSVPEGFYEWNRFAQVMFLGYRPDNPRNDMPKSTFDYLTAYEFEVVRSESSLRENVFLVEGNPYPPDFKKTVPQDELCIDRCWITGSPHYLLLKAERRYHDEPLWSLTISAYADYEDFKYPHVGKYKLNQPGPDDKVIIEEYIFEVVFFAIDRELTEGDFTFDWPAYTGVNDSVNGRGFRIPKRPDNVTEAELIATTLKAAKSPEVRISLEDRAKAKWLLCFNVIAFMAVCALLAWRWKRRKGAQSSIGGEQV